MTRALVTGSTGFLGSSLVAALNERNIEVLGLRRKNSPGDAVEGLDLQFAVGDILEPETLPDAMKDIDWVFHIAAVSDHRHTASDVIYRVNVEGARHVFAAALKAGVKRVVFTSSSSALGIPTQDQPILDESSQFNLEPHEFPYGHSKYLAEQVMEEYVAQGLDAVSVLPSAVVGPRDLKFISGELIIQALKGGIPALPRGGLNYIDVRDCVESQIAAAEKGHSGERYILAGTNMTHRESLQIVSTVLGTAVPPMDIPPWFLPIMGVGVEVLRKMGVKLPINKEALLMGARYLYYHNTKAVRDLGLQVRPFADSIRDAYGWYLEHGYLEKRGLKPAPLPNSGI